MLYFEAILGNGKRGKTFFATEDEAGEIQFALHEAYEPQQTNIVMAILQERAGTDCKAFLIYDDADSSLVQLYGFISWNEMPQLIVRDSERLSFYKEHPEFEFFPLTNRGIYRKTEFYGKIKDGDWEVIEVRTTPTQNTLFAVDICSCGGDSDFKAYEVKPSAYDNNEATFVDGGKVIRVKSIDVDFDNGDCRCIGYRLDK